MKENFVITFSGKEALATNCVQIDGYWYIMNEECIHIGSYWYPLTSPLLYRDYHTGEYRKKNRETVKGIIDYNEKDGCIRDFFQMGSKVVSISEAQGGTEFVYSQEILDKIPTSFNKTLGTTTLLYKGTNSTMERLLSNCVGKKVHCYSFPEAYSSSELLKSFAKDTHNEVTKNISVNSKHVAEFGDYSFGVEFETSAGNIGEKDCHKYGLIPLKDGSISGHEYATIPMKGIDGFKLLLAQLNLLRESCYFDKECSLHVHLGGFPIDAEKIFALYRLCTSIEKPLSRMFCKYALDTRLFKAKQKDYCTSLPLKYNNFKDFYYWLSGGNVSYDGTLTYAHPQDREERAKWQMGSRYTWANFINLCFKNHGKTAEFRIHAPSFNTEKVINWLFICAALLKYADKHSSKLIKGSISIRIEDILKDSYSEEVAAQLIKYYNLRVEFFELSYIKYNDPSGHYDLQLDSKITFGTNLITNV